MSSNLPVVDVVLRVARPEDAEKLARCNEWRGWALDALQGIEPHEVLQVLTAELRWPRAATGAGGLQVVTVWGRTADGRLLIVAVRQASTWDWLILGARDTTPAETEEFAQWEEKHRD